MSFLDDILDFTKEYEAPQRFYYWAGLCSISAVLKDNVYFNMGEAYKLYPNIYTLLYGPSGIRKGPPIAMAEKLVKRVNNTRVINGRATIEAIIKELGTFKTKPGGMMDKDSSGFIVASELSSSIVTNPSAMDIMTNLYDRIYNTDDWEYKLKVGESHKLIKPTITWLSGTNESLFKEFLPEKNIHGGLIGRMFIINENKKNTINSLMYKPNRPLDDHAYNILVQQLMPLKLLKGEFQMGDDVRALVDTWYKKFNLKDAPTINDQTGFVGRMEDFLLKIAMLISCGRRGDMILTVTDIMEAHAVVSPLLIPIAKMSDQIQKEDKSKYVKRGIILKYLVTHEVAFRKQMMRDIGLQISTEDLDEMVNYLFGIDALEQGRYGSEITYKLKRSHPKIGEWIKKFT